MEKILPKAKEGNNSREIKRKEETQFFLIPKKTLMRGKKRFMKLFT